MKTLYLHIGTPKTATSSVQLFCRKNRPQLHRYGYEFPILLQKYPLVGHDRNGHFLVDSSPKLDGNGRIENTEDDTPKRREIRRKHLAAGMKAVHKAFDRYDNVILSDESLWLSLNYNQRNPLDILCGDAQEYGYRIKVIVYLRRQDQFVISRWNQLIKEGAVSQTFQEYLDDLLTRRPLIVDYAESLDRIAAKIGKENVIVRRFEPSTWVGGSVYTDFMDAISLAPDAPVKPLKKAANTSLTLNFVEIQRQINASTDISNARKSFLCYFLRKASRKHEEHSGYGAFSTEETREFLARYEEGNARLAKEYLGEEGSLFSPVIKETRKWTPDNEYMEEDRNFFSQEISKASHGLPLWEYRCKHLIKEGTQKVLSRF
ncbi:MAG: hypothetical protein LUI39_05015 [Lachnospiraceae bacterium]|nr:hypothetical protein [Lachnospiraceae bacterium]